MAAPTRTHPNIPDHDVLRKIGGGAYGEVWMARGVTGAMRAVKVVWREDFDDERTFEREFEGILKFEPISRDHPALVNILHVGRSPDGVSFYYYVMELGDDVVTGQDINPIEYEARTLRPDGKSGVRLETGLCIDVGLRLAEALDHLHSIGLAHRDVKPSNVIFVNGKAKLADIGLVAARDQRTFVGTEGFVPPEGPGSAQADVYSLGKVLYEIATGKDRLDFPELPDELPTGLERKRWLDLNRIICEVCEPRISKRNISTAADLAAALRQIQRGKRRRSHGLSIWGTTLVLLGFAGWASVEALKDSDLLPWGKDPAKPAPITRYGLLRVAVLPEGSEVFSDDGTPVGITPTETLRLKVGSEVNYIIRKKGYRPLAVTAVVTPESAKDPMIISGELLNFSPPALGEKWEDHLAITYLPQGDGHISSGFVNKRVWMDFLKSSKRSPRAVEFITVSENGKPSEIVLASQPEMIAFSDWVRAGGIRDGYLTQDHEVAAELERSFDDPKLSDRARREKLLPFRILVREFSYGGIQLVSEPPGAEVYMNGVAVGSTVAPPLLIPKVKPGGVELLLILEGYKPLTLKASVKAGENLPMSAVLQKNESVVFEKPWQNGMKMKFEPITADLMGAVWETRVRDYQVFLNDTKREQPPLPDFPQNPDHPVVNVSREDAIAFCEWLTRREFDRELIAQSHQYRLPTDEEWSLMAGLEGEEGDGPGQRDANKRTIYAWGAKWPPPNAVANYADSTAAAQPGVAPGRVIPDYDDGFPHTAPVGSFPPNELGLFDISGNVQEWVSDDIFSAATSPLGVVRGAGWNSFIRENLQLGWRNPVPPAFRSPFYGFRIVLSRGDPTPETAEDGDSASPEG
jgi:eukaryotic-like serine/threonine-protein kinase